MEYFKLLNLEKEPFSNSPDPDCFFKSRQHEECLQKIELSLRLRRGLNVVIGDVGTGKTTLCRQLIKKFSRDAEIDTHLILDPHMADPSAFLKVLAEMFSREPDNTSGDWSDHKEFIKKYLFKRGVDEERIVVLIIDEGQKIPASILEILRELLNYETNEYKLLQIVIFAQHEFEDILERHANFADRINLLHTLGPLGFRDTKLMIDYRLQKAGSENSLESMLSRMALVAIYRATGGYPRKIVNLCHRVMLAMIVKNKKKAGWRLVRSCATRSASTAGIRWRKIAGALLVIGGVAGFAYIGFAPSQVDTVMKTALNKAFPVVNEAVKPVAQPVLKNPGQHSTVTSDLEQEKPPVVDPFEGTAVKQVDGGLEKQKVPEKTVDLIEPEVKAVAVVAPQTLGMIRMKDNETLSWLMIKVYGEYTNRRRRDMADGNPRIKDLDNILAGQVIDFPAIAYKGKSPPGFISWLRVDSVGTVSAALDIVRSRSTKAAPLRIIPHWRDDAGLLFDIIFWKYFSSVEGAERYRDKLPDAVRQISEIIPGWHTTEVFYANPCPGIG